MIGVQVNEFSDAEIEQFHAALFGDKDVAGFQVAVDDVMVLRILNRITNHAKQADAFADV